MAQRRHHYEGAFEEYLRSRRIPYVAVDEARKALIPPRTGGSTSLKSFDFVLYGPGQNLLLEVKGRKIPLRRAGSPSGTGRFECWVTEEDIASLTAWETLFGEGFAAAIAFVYWCEAQPEMPLFEEIFEFRGRWYAIRLIRLAQYVRSMRPRSPRWRTVDLPGEAFKRLSGTLGEALADHGAADGAEQAATDGPPGTALQFFGTKVASQR